MPQVPILFSEPKRLTRQNFFPYEWFDGTEKLSKKDPRYDSFLSILRNSNPIEKTTVTLKTMSRVVCLESKY